MHRIKVASQAVDVVRKDIKHLHLAVYPPNGRVRVAAPLRVDDEAVRLAVRTRLGWVKRQQARFQGQERQSAREYVTGESHYYQGRRYRLNVIEHAGPQFAHLRNKSALDLFVRSGADTAQRERVLLAWYRRQLREMVTPLVTRWEAVLGVRVAGWGIRRMRTRWGTCNAEAGRIWLNLELVKKPAHCLEYVVVHEMVHLLERRHGERFAACMDASLPQWRAYREELNSAPLAHEEWGY